ncbi:MAG: hypothetical protein H6735_16760 [Alphaproteobacteria bacterium]|nr:hypothetical protein [Alphaproteobacteria bacterium]
MRCDEVLAALDLLASGGLPTAPMVEALTRSELVARAPVAAGASGIATLRDDLRSVQARRREAVQRVAEGVDGAREQVAELDREERELRSAILELADLPAAAGSVPQLTFRGRDLQGELRTRVGRVGGEPLTVFLAAFEDFRRRLSDTAARAAALLAKLSPENPAVDEIHLRAAALSLATARPMDPVEVVARDFGTALSFARPAALDDEGRVQLAEAWASRPTGKVVELIELSRVASTLIPDRGDAVSAAAIAWGEGPDRERVLRAGVELAKGWGAGELAPGVLLVGAEGEGRASRIQGLVGELAPVEPDASAARWSAVLLALSPAEPSVALARFQQVRAWLSRFGTDGLSAPAAMLALLDAEAPELLDDLRLASNAVRLHKLSLSALENLGLGVKLLVEVGLGRVAVPLGGSTVPLGLDAAASSVALPLSSFPPRFTQAVATYHRATIHHRVVRHDWHHPVHTHRVYG